MSVALCGAQWTISAGGHEAVVVEVGGGLRAYRVDGVAVLDEYDPDEVAPGSSGKVLVPWPNRIRDGRYTFGGRQLQLGLSEAVRHNAIHGLACWVPWRPVAQSAGSVTLECHLSAQPGYPWPLRVRTQWSVDVDGLTARHEATNLGSRPAPFGLGVHPYLRVAGGVDEALLRVPAHSRLLLDGRMLPIGAAKVAGGDYDYTEPRRIGPAVLDTAFGDVTGEPVVLSTVEGSRTVWADGSFRWWQVFTNAARRALAVEAMTCPPDAFRSGRDLVTLEPGQTWTGSWGITTDGIR
jgi:aldose 1-epimerase